MTHNESAKRGNVSRPLICLQLMREVAYRLPSFCLHTSLLSMLKEIKDVLHNEFIIPKAIIVGFGREQIIQHICYVCNGKYFPAEKHSFLCDSCHETEISFKVDADPVFRIDIIDWEQRITMSKKRSTYNFRKAAIRDEFTCRYCGYSPRYVFSVNRLLHIDHIVPFSHGGNNSLDNLATSCSHCNVHLSNKCFDSFLDKKCFIFELNTRRGLPATKTQWFENERLVKRNSN